MRLQQHYIWAFCNPVQGNPIALATYCLLVSALPNRMLQVLIDPPSVLVFLILQIFSMRQRLSSVINDAIILLQLLREDSGAVERPLALHLLGLTLQLVQS